MQNRIMLLDTNHSVKPIYDFLISTGAEVFVVGKVPNHPLAKQAKNYICLDYSDVEKVRLLIKKLSIDFLVPGGNDLSYRVCSFLNNEIGFYNIDSIEVNETINNKGKLRQFLASHNLHSPRVIELEEIEHCLPVIIKPTEGYSGKGITVISEKQKGDIKKAIDYAKKNSKSNDFIIEEFVQGQLYSHSAFIVDGRILIDFIVEEHCTVNPFVVDTSRVVHDFDKKYLEKIRSDISIIIKKLGLCDGLIHTQFIYNGSDFWIIEITRRCPGDLYSSLIELSTGFPYAKFYAKPFLNKKNSIKGLSLKRSFVLRHTITVGEERHFNFISFKVPTKMLTFVPLSVSGELLQKSPLSRVGIFFWNTDSEEGLNFILNKCYDNLLYSIG